MTPVVRDISEPPGERDTMWIKPFKNTKKLSVEILQYLLLSILVALFVFSFLYSTSISIADTYFLHKQITLTEMQNMTLNVWVRSLCILATIFVFLLLFFLMLGRKLSYLIAITKEIEVLQSPQAEICLPLEGSDELTCLAETVNRLYLSQKELAHKQAQLKEERENWIRSLSHDIRTPLTSIIGYSEFLKNKETLQQEEIHAYFSLVQSKAEQIKELTDQLMGRKEGTWENIENIKFLLEQLVSEWEAVLDETFTCRTDLSGCAVFGGMMEVYSLRRIMDNLASNIEKYADPDQDVCLEITSSGQKLRIIEKNSVRAPESRYTESHGLGIPNIRQAAAVYDGNVEILQTSAEFQITINLNIRPCL